MTRILFLFGALIFVSVAVAQPGTNPNAFTCVANAGTPVIVRVEGITELAGDLLLNCVGGTPTPAGQKVPAFNFRLTLNTGVTSRLLGNGNIEALLLIDEPSPSNLQVCTNPPCTVTATSNPSTVYTTPGNANAYMGRLVGPSTVEWDGVPIDAPSTTGQHIYRITNVRANANQIGLTNITNPTSIVGLISVTPAFTIKNPQQTLATPQPGLLYGTTPGSFQYCNGFNGNQLFSESTPGVPGPATFQMFATENFPFAFRPQGTTTQNVPGQVYNSESAFTIPSLGIGTANFGTIIQGTIENVPDGVNAAIPLQVPLVNSSGATEGSASAGQTGTVSGNSMTLLPSSGVVQFFYEVKQRTGTDPLTAAIPVTLAGTPAQVPANLQGVISFANSQFPQTTLFAPGSSLLNGYPIFGSLDPGITNPAIVPYQQLGSIVPCTNAGTTLSGTVSGPMFQEITDLGGSKSPDGVVAHAATPVPPTTLIVPRISNVGLVSTALPASGLNILKDPNATWLNVGLNQTTTPATLLMSVNPTSPGLYTTNVQVSSPNASTSVTVPVTYSVDRGVWFTRFGFVHLASYVSNVVAPGEPFVIYAGDNFGPEQIVHSTVGANGLLDSTLDGVQVLFDGTPAPLFYVVDANGDGQVAGVAPFGLSSKTQTSVQVISNSSKSPPVTLFVLDAVPGLFTADSSGGGQGAILNHDMSSNSSSNPEAIGNEIVLYGGGAGQTSPAGRDGALAGVGGPLSKFTLPVKVFIDGIEATDIPYAGAAPGLVEGMFQINVRIPAGVRRNMSVPVVVQIEDKQTQPGVMVATK